MACDAGNYSKRRDYDFLTIKNIEFSHREEAQCIKVDARDELYLTEDFIVTHNTTIVVQLSGNIIRQFKFANIIHSS